MVVSVISKVSEVALRIFGSSNERTIREMLPLVDEVCALEPDFQKKSDAELRELTERFRERLRGKSYEEKQHILDEMLPAAFANAREAARRMLVTPAPDSPYPTMRPFDVSSSAATHCTNR